MSITEAILLGLFGSPVMYEKKRLPKVSQASQGSLKAVGIPSFPLPATRAFQVLPPSVLYEAIMPFWISFSFEAANMFRGFAGSMAMLTSDWSAFSLLM